MVSLLDLKSKTMKPIGLTLAAIAAASFSGEAVRGESVVPNTGDRSKQDISEMQIPQSRNVEYDRYQNWRFNFSFIYPENFVEPQAPPTNNDGREFVSEDGLIRIVGYGSHFLGYDSLDEAYREATQDRPANNRDRVVTYQTRGENWFVVSGYDGDMVFYTKKVFNNDKFKTLDIRYDRDLQPEFDAIVREISRSFQA